MTHLGKRMMLFVALLMLFSLVPSLTPAAAQDGCGCVRTPGYWKNHAWPPGVSDEVLPGEGITWSEALWAQPHGSAYFILAKAYVAARLNEAAGAVPGCSICISSHLERAYNYLSQPYVWWEHWREDVIADAQYLDDWNNGLLPGVPSCPD